MERDQAAANSEMNGEDEMIDLTRRGLLKAGTANLATLSASPTPGFAQATQPKRGGTVVLAINTAPPSLDGH